MSTPPLTLISVDPGLDYVAAVAWRVAGWRGTPLLTACAHRYLREHTLRTLPSERLEDRLRDIAAWVHSLCGLYPPGTVRLLVELPARAGASYARNQATQRTKTDPGAAHRAYLYAALGALVGGVPADVQVELVEASRVPKSQRRALVDSVLPQLKGRNADVHDAAFYGLQALASWPPVLATPTQETR